MKLDVELSDDMFRQLMLKADKESLPVHEIMLRGVQLAIREIPRGSYSFELPVVPSSNPD